MYNNIVYPQKFMYAKRIKKAHPRKFLSGNNKITRKLSSAKVSVRDSFYA